MIAPSVRAELLKVSDWMSLPTSATSFSAIALASVVSFISAMKSFRSGGMTFRIACGTTTKRIACPWLMPSDLAASVWPCGTASIPALYTSAMYAP
jgi:hypothetical protein